MQYKFCFFSNKDLSFDFFSSTPELIIILTFLIFRSISSLIISQILSDERFIITVLLFSNKEPDKIFSKKFSFSS